MKGFLEFFEHFWIFGAGDFEGCPGSFVHSGEGVVDEEVFTGDFDGEFDD